MKPTLDAKKLAGGAEMPEMETPGINPTEQMVSSAVMPRDPQSSTLAPGGEMAPTGAEPLFAPPEEEQKKKMDWKALLKRGAAGFAGYQGDPMAELSRHKQDAAMIQGRMY